MKENNNQAFSKKIKDINRKINLLYNEINVVKRKIGFLSQNGFVNNEIDKKPMCNKTFYVQVVPPYIEFGKWYVYDGVEITPREINALTREIKCETRDGGMVFVKVDAIEQFKEIKEEPEHQWKPGDWCYCETPHECKIWKIVGKHHICGFALLLNLSAVLVKKDGALVEKSYAYLRPLTPADWTREIDGVKYRAYEFQGMSISLLGKCENGNKFDNSSCQAIIKAFCRLAGIPIMPYELNKGKYEYPE